MWFEERGVETKAEVCEAGHVQCFYVPIRSRRGGRCLVCGRPTMADCPACGSPIGRRAGAGFMPVIRRRDLRPPAHCQGCGTPFPWATRGGSHARMGAVRARARRHLAFRIAHAARTTRCLAAGTADAARILAWRGSRTAASVKSAHCGSYMFDAGSTRQWINTERVGSRWYCDCEDFEGDAARCRHIWAVALLGAVHRLSRRLGVPWSLEGLAGEGPKMASWEDLRRSVVAASPGFREKARSRIRAAWGRYLDWEQESNTDMAMAVSMAGGDPGRAMHHAQQAAEKQIKATRVYGAAFDGGFSPKSLNHDIFASRAGKDFKRMLDDHRPELRRMTLGIRTDPARSGIVRYLGEHPALVAYVTDVDDNTLLSTPPREITIGWYYRYLQRRLRPPWFQPTETGCPTLEYVSHAAYRDPGFGGGEKAFLSGWRADARNMMNDFVLGTWRWRYYALYVHEDARYPSEFSHVYLQNAEIVKRWVFAAGYMTSIMQNSAREYHAAHTVGDGEDPDPRTRVVRDESWYANQMRLGRR